MCECAVNDIPGELTGGRAAGLPYQPGTEPVVQLPGVPWDLWKGGICQVWWRQSPGEHRLSATCTSPRLEMRPGVIFVYLCYLLKKQKQTGFHREGGIPLTLHSYSTGQPDTSLARDLYQCKGP